MKPRVKRHTVVQPTNTSYRLIPLTKGKNAIVDAKNFSWLSQWNWYALHMKGRYYAYRGGGQRGRVFIAMHRQILGCSPTQEGDHENGDSLDNRIENLRPCTHAQNQINRGKQKNNTSGFKGVGRARESGIWRAYIKVSGKFVHVGHFTTAEEAARAYDEAAKEHFGEFAHLNFPHEIR